MVAAAETRTLSGGEDLPDMRISRGRGGEAEDEWVSFPSHDRQRDHVRLPLRHGRKMRERNYPGKSRESFCQIIKIINP